MPKNKPRKTTQAVAISALILNLFILPGLGTMVAGDDKKGLKQIIFFLLGILLTVTIILAIIGIPLLIGIWVWGLNSAIKMVKQAE